MESIRKRGKSWQAQVRSRKTGSIGKSFHRKADAERWAIEREALMQNGQFARTQTQSLNLGDLMQAYAEKVIPTKKWAAQEFRRITLLVRERDLMFTPLPDAKLHIFASSRDRRLQDGVRACQYDLASMRDAVLVADKNHAADIKQLVALMKDKHILQASVRELKHRHWG